MDSWLSGQTVRSLPGDGRPFGMLRALAGALALLFCLPVCAWAQSMPAPERDALVKLHTDRGGRAEDVDVLVRLVNDAAGRGLPSTVLTNKIREGLAKGYDPRRVVEPAIRQMTTRLETADRLIRDMDSVSSGAGREASVTLLAEAIGSGVTPEEVRELGRAASGSGRPPLAGEGLASAAKGLSSIKEAQLPVAEGTAVVAEAVRQGFRPYEILDLGREVKRRESEYRSGRASLGALRDAIARGERLDQLFRDSRRAPAERPATTRPQPPVERPARPEAPTRPDPAPRPDRPATGRDR